jgi:hypothetical protein
MAKLIFNEQGEIWPESSLELRRLLHYFRTNDDFASLLVRNLGYISLVPGQSSATITFRPQVVSEVAIAAMLTWLWDRQPERVLLTHVHDHHDEHEILRSPSAVARRIGEVVTRKTESNVFRSRRRDPRCLTNDSSFGALLELWRASSERLDWSRHLDFFKENLDGRFIVLSAESPQSDLRIEAAGYGLRVPGSNWFTDNIGAPLSLMPDCFYRQRVSEGYYATLQTGEPCLEDIEATIFWPRYELVRRRYSRLILRCRSKSGPPDLLGVTRACA